MGGDRKSKKKRSPTTSSSEDEGKKKRRRSSETKSDKKEKEYQRSHKSRKSSSNKEKKPEEKHKHKHKRHKHDRVISNFKELSDADYFLKNNEFSTWLKDERDTFFSDLSSESSRKLFAEFVKDWNNKKLDSKYYDGIVTAPRSSHNWKIKVDPKGDPQRDLFYANRDI